MNRFNPRPTGPLRVVVLCGGNSDEREISLKSGTAVAEALDSRGHEVVKVDPAMTDLHGFDWQDNDVAFIALHGSFGEDGQIQSLLDEFGVAYTGSDASASRLAFSKSAAKGRFQQEGLPTPAYVLIHETDDASRIEQQARTLGFPLVVKPDAQGSSLGVTIVDSPRQLAPALSRCFHHDSYGILERMIPGEEWTTAVFDYMVLPPIRVETPRSFYDFRAKYEDDQTTYDFAPETQSELTRRLESTSLAACDAVGTRGIARVDLRVDQYDQPWILEVNTVPGMTRHSLAPKAAQKAGMNLGMLCELSIRGCLSAACSRRRAG